MAKAEGKTFEYLDESHIDNSLLEVFDFDSEEQYIKTETDEFSAVCPFSGLPDISYVKIEYYPKGGKCVELKSLKYYFVMEDLILKMFIKFPQLFLIYHQRLNRLGEQ